MEITAIETRAQVRQTGVHPAPQPDLCFEFGGRELVTLQFVARGYTPTEIASACRMPTADVVSELRAATDALGAASVREAIALAASRGLIR